MTKTTLGGASLIIFAAALCVSNSMDIISDLRDWHAVTTPHIVAAILKQAASVVMGAVGGTMLPQLGNGAN